MSAERVFIANRGEIALRIIRSCRALGLATIVAVSTADRDGLVARTADKSICVGPGPAMESYLNQKALVVAALNGGATLVHPGYGFLSENAEFAALCTEHGLNFVGPSSEVIARMGNKVEARRVAVACGVPLLPGTGVLDGVDNALAEARAVGYPVMLKASAGGGGRGIRVLRSDGELVDSFPVAAEEARAAFGDGSMYLEKYVENAWHIEVQLVGYADGIVQSFGTRDCSVQRKHQKVIEEAGAYRLSPEETAQITTAAVRIAESVGYRNAGTVEFVFDADTRAFYFLEVNTRIQVEHPVTEMVYGVDLVRTQLEVAMGGDAGQGASVGNAAVGHAIECRIVAEDPDRGFRPSPGVISEWKPPRPESNLRFDFCGGLGEAVLPFYDSLIGKMVVWGETREDAIDRMLAALGALHIGGVQTNVELQRRLVDSRVFREGKANTTWLESGHLDG